MLRFTIRELILLTIIVAMGAAWWVQSHELAIVKAELHARDAEARFAKLRALELDRKAIIDSAAF